MRPGRPCWGAELTGDGQPAGGGGRLWSRTFRKGETACAKAPRWEACRHTSGSEQPEQQEPSGKHGACAEVGSGPKPELDHGFCGQSRKFTFTSKSSWRPSCSTAQGAGNVSVTKTGEVSVLRKLLVWWGGWCAHHRVPRRCMSRSAAGGALGRLWAPSRREMPVAWFGAAASETQRGVT